MNMIAQIIFNFFKRFMVFVEMEYTIYIPFQQKLKSSHYINKVQHVQMIQLPEIPQN